MALRLAGEQAGVLRGVDAVGWLREVTVSDTLPGLKVDQQGTGRVVDFQDGGTSKLHVLDGGRVVVANSIEVGANPSALGLYRASNGPAGGIISARNSANTANVAVINVDSADQILLGDGSTAILPGADNTQVLGNSSSKFLSGYFGAFVAIGATTATTGEVRIPNASFVRFRNAANTANLDALQVDALNVIGIGNTGPNPGGIQIGQSGSLIGLFGAAVAAKPTVTGSRGGNLALADLLTKGATLGLWTDSTTA